MLGRTPVAAAIRALRNELAGGPPADLGRDVHELSNLLAERELRRRILVQDPVEQELLAALPDAAALVGKDGRVRSCNAAFDGLAPQARAVGRTPVEIARSPELSHAVHQALDGIARRLEITLDRKVLLVHAAPLLRGEVMLLLRDVTEAKRAETTRRDFVANASHELRTPIAAVRAAAETLLSGALDDRAAARSFVEIVSRQAERLSRLTQDLLDLSRLESRQWRFEVAPVELEPLARQAIEPVSGEAHHRGLALVVDVPQGLRVRGDARALEQVLVNLVDNAVKYTPAGRITVSAIPEGGTVVLSVSDTGPGIERHHLPRLFERFYRVDPGRSREQGGTGLGLTIVKHLVQGMSGEVGVESDAGGSRFWARLPLA